MMTTSPLDHNDDGTWIPLLKREALFQNHTLAVGVQSRYQTTNVSETLAYLSSRAAQVVQQNPFLVGRLRTRRSSGGWLNNVWTSATPALWIPPEPDYDSFFQVVEVEKEEDFESSSSSSSSSSSLEACHLGRGNECIDKDVPVFRLSAVVVRNNGQDKKKKQDFLLTLSCVHMVGDIGTIYQIWNLLSVDCDLESVKPLIPERVPHYPDVHVTFMKGNSYKRFLYWFLCSDLSPIRQQIPCLKAKPPAEPCVFACHYVNMEWVEAQKKQHNPDDYPKDPVTGKSTVPYLSTADVLSHWFFSQLSPSVAFVLMNMRGRHERVSAQHVGNYFDMLCLYPAQYQSAARLRQAVSSLGAYETEGSSRPGPGWSAAQVTGWQSAYTQVNLPGCTHVLHQPLRHSTCPVVKPNLILFKTDQSAYGVATLTCGPLKDTSALGPVIPGPSPCQNERVCVNAYEKSDANEPLLDKHGTRSRDSQVRKRK